LEIKGRVFRMPFHNHEEEEEEERDGGREKYRG
jgi:hypothetical protein